MSQETDQAPESKDNEFTCFICGSHDFKEKKQSNGILGPNGRTSLEYECAGCSIEFGDPIKFNEVFLLIGTLKNPKGIKR